MASRIEFITAADAAGLVSRLVSLLEGWRRQFGALSPVDVVVPHRAMRAWLPLELSAQTGGIAHLRFRSPGDVVSPGRHRPTELTGLLFAALDDERLARKPFAAFRTYVEREEGKTRRQQRRYELARRLARTFETYHAHWPEGPRQRTAGPVEGAESAQAELWSIVEAGLIRPPGTDDGTPVVVFDLPLPGFDFIKAVRARRGPVAVLSRAGTPKGDEDIWRRHGELRSHGLERWGVTTAAAGAAPPPLPLPLPGVELLEAPSDRRALEGAVSKVWSWLREAPASEPLRVHDIALVVPESRREALLPMLREVMLEAHDLPKVLWNVPLGGHNTVAALARQLLLLPSGPLRRPDLLSVLTHPLVTSALEDDLPEEWPAWLDAVGIFHGLDDLELSDTYLQGLNAAHWDQGLSRLALGAFLGGERSGEATGLSAAAGRLVAEERTQSSHASVGVLLGLVRSLLSDAAALREAELTCAEWRTVLVELLATYVRPAAPLDRRTLSALLRALQAVEDAGLPGRISFGLAQRLALDALDALPADVGAHLTRGVVVGTPSDLAGLPFRRLVFLGLEAGAFPATSHRDELDLRPDDHVRLDDARRRDAAAFFDLLHGTSEQVCLVHLDRHPLDGEERAPSLLVADLLEHLKKGGYRPLARDLPLERHIQASTDPAFAKAFPEAAAERALHETGVQLEAAMGRPPVLADLPAGWADFVRGQAPARKPLEDGVIEVTLDALATWLRCPAQGYAKHQLRMKGADDDRLDLIDEPFIHDRLTEASLLRGAMHRVLTSHMPSELRDAGRAQRLLEQAREDELQAALARGEAALGLFGEVQRAKDLRTLGEWLTTVLEELPDGSDGIARRLRWGRARAGDRHGWTVLPALEFEATLGTDKRLVRVTGESGLLFGDDALSLHLRLQPAFDGVRKKWKEAAHRRAGLAPWVEHLLLASTSRHLGGVVGVDTKCKPSAWKFRRLEADTARGRLELLLAEFLQDRVGYRSPALVHFKHWDKLGAVDDNRRSLFSDACSEVYAGRYPVESTRYAPVSGIPDLPDPTDEQLDTVRCRLSTYLEDLAAAPASPEAP